MYKKTIKNGVKGKVYNIQLYNIIYNCPIK